MYKDSFHILFERLMKVKFPVKEEYDDGYSDDDTPRHTDGTPFTPEEIEGMDNWLDSDEGYVQITQLEDKRSLAGFVEWLKVEMGDKYDEDDVLRIVGAVSKMNPRPYSITDASDAAGGNNDTEHIKPDKILPIVMVLPMDYDLETGEGGHNEVKILNMQTFVDGMGRQWIDIMDLNDLTDEDEEGPSL
jgi:hypothetical protein